MTIGYLKGENAGVHGLSNRTILLVDVGGVGYEVQVLPRWVPHLPDLGDRLTVHTHLQIRDDRQVLYGFSSQAERELFRQLIAVSGIGPQMAVSLMDGLAMSELVQAIVSGNVKLLSRTPGVGKKTAERITLELRTKLAQWRDDTGLSTAPAAGPVNTVREDVEMTLLALGYSQREVLQALEAVGRQKPLSKTGDGEDWIREAIAWLSVKQ
ncbi:MAG: Holliday junction branch migration protein RuvA [Cyanophyceae cyanobacterium]